MDESRDEEWRFGDVLSQLKRRGCTILITGHGPERAFDRLSTQLLGGQGARRSRVFGLVDREVEAARSRLQQAGPGFEPALVVDTAADVSRAASAASPSSLNDRELTVRHAGRSPSALESELIDAIHDARQLHGPFEPGEFRLCVDSLRPLAEHSNTEAVRSLLDAVGATVVQADGMGHFVFPGDRDDPAIRSLVPAADVLIELRDENEYVEQRWTFRDFDVPALWTSL